MTNIKKLLPALTSTVLLCSATSCSIFLDNRKEPMESNHPVAIYEKFATGSLYSPFNIAIDPMDRLLLLTFDGDPYYECIEIQVFDDKYHGKGLAALMGRKNGKVDVYFQPGLHLDKSGYGVAAGLNAWTECQMSAAKYEVTPTGVNLHVAFTDVDGRPIEARIHETDTAPRKPTDLLAPLGSGIQNPTWFPCVYLYNFNFVRKRGTDLLISIDGKQRSPQSIPVPIDGAFVHFTRYSPRPAIGKLNQNYDGQLAPLKPKGPGEWKDGKTTYQLVQQDGHYEIESLSATQGSQSIGIRFAPPVPDLAAIRDGVTLKGSFALKQDKNIPICAGGYTVTRKGKDVLVDLDPTEGWQPQESRLSYRFIYFVAGMFKSWPTTYHWSAKLHLDDTPTLQTEWTRKNK